ncbi:MAG: hypothetical protein M0Z41_16255 [Peptococcaceae bacterium]|jgi:hypothetical protein|nr:hypothetical protein [Peptococcaceae bacterium]
MVQMLGYRDPNQSGGFPGHGGGGNGPDLLQSTSSVVLRKVLASL